MHPTEEVEICGRRLPPPSRRAPADLLDGPPSRQPGPRQSWPTRVATLQAPPAKYGALQSRVVDNGSPRRSSVHGPNRGGGPRRATRSFPRISFVGPEPATACHCVWFRAPQPTRTNHRLASWRGRGPARRAARARQACCQTTARLRARAHACGGGPPATVGTCGAPPRSQRPRWIGASARAAASGTPQRAFPPLVCRAPKSAVAASTAHAPTACTRPPTPASTAAARPPPPTPPSRSVFASTHGTHGRSPLLGFWTSSSARFPAHRFLSVVVMDKLQEVRCAPAEGRWCFSYWRVRVRLASPLLGAWFCFLRAHASVISCIS